MSSLLGKISAQNLPGRGSQEQHAQVEMNLVCVSNREGQGHQLGGVPMVEGDVRGLRGGVVILPEGQQELWTDYYRADDLIDNLTGASWLLSGEEGRK